MVNKITDIKKVQQRNTKTGASNYICICKEMSEALNLQKDTRVIIELEDSQITIKKI